MMRSSRLHASTWCNKLHCFCWKWSDEMTPCVKFSHLNTVCWSSVMFWIPEGEEDQWRTAVFHSCFVQGHWDDFSFPHLLGVRSIFTKNPSRCVQTLHFFNCYHHPPNNMLHGFIFLQGGFCPLGPAVTIPVDSRTAHFLSHRRSHLQRLKHQTSLPVR